MIRAHSWDSIENHYASLINHGWQHQKLLELVKHIRTTGLSERLFAYTSLDSLNVTVYETIELGSETLRITLDRELKVWHFEYFATPFMKPEFERKYPEEMGIGKFENFIKMIGW